MSKNILLDSEKVAYEQILDYFQKIPPHGTKHPQTTEKIPCGDFTSIKKGDIIVIQG